MGGILLLGVLYKDCMSPLQDREAKYIAPAMTRAYALFQKRLRTPRAIQAAMDRLVPDLAGYGIHKCGYYY